MVDLAVQGLNRSLLDKFKSLLPFELGEEQYNVLLSIYNFISEEGFNIGVLMGSAGTGKSTISKLVINYLIHHDYEFILAAPTNKAKIILEGSSGWASTTLHKLLKLRPDLDIIDLNLNDLKFKSENYNEFPRGGIIIIDECSMINEHLYDHIVKMAKKAKCKILFQGDPKQLAPVKENNISKSFQSPNKFELNVVYRQSDDNPVMDILTKLRSSPVKTFIPYTSSSGSMIIFDNWRKLMDETAEKFIDSDIKLIAYTNKRVEAFNEIIRSRIFDNPKEYESGDILVGYDNCSLDSKDAFIVNSEEYTILTVSPIKITINSIRFNAFELTLSPKYTESQVDLHARMLSKDNEESKFNKLAELIETTRMAAVNAKTKISKNIKWREYFNIMNSFLTPVDLKFNNRVVRKKSMDYGYCITVHKSQGSSYEDVVIDMSNIKICYNKEELRQLQYVALSRTKNNIYMLA